MVTVSKNGVTGKFLGREHTHDEMVIFEIWGDFPFYLPEPQYEVEPGYQVIDIGGHIGSYTVYAALRGAKVITFEPHPETFNMLKQNVENNGIADKVTLINAGAWNEDTFKDMITSAFHTGGNSFIQNIFGDGHIQAELRDINKIMDPLKKVDILKVDCEGSEYTVFESMTEENLKKVQRIVMETHLGFERGEALLRFLTEKGFKTKHIPGLDGTMKTWAERVKK